MNFIENQRDLTEVIRDGDAITLMKMECEIVEYVDYVMLNQGDGEEYLTFLIAQHPDHNEAYHMYQAFRKVCRKESQYHWHEIMKVMGRSVMCGAVMSQNLKVLEQAMFHMDEKELEDLLYDIDAPEVSKWYDEKFVSM